MTQTMKDISFMLIKTLNVLQIVDAQTFIHTDTHTHEHLSTCKQIVHYLYIYSYTHTH